MRTLGLVLIVGVMFMQACLADGQAGRVKPEQPIIFAIIVGEMTGDESLADWLPAGMAFDIEKRLGRMPGLEPAERLDLKKVIGNIEKPEIEQKVKAVFEQLKPDAIITITGNCAAEQLKAQLQLWLTTDSMETLHTIEGPTDDLFRYHDEITDKLQAALLRNFPTLQKPGEKAKPHAKPAASLQAYEYLIRGITTLQSGDKTALAHLGKAMELDSSSFWVQYFMGALKFREGHYIEARQCCEDAIAIDPDLYPGVYANLSYIYEVLRENSRADWARKQFEDRTGKPVPMRALPMPGVMAPQPIGSPSTLSK